MNTDNDVKSEEELLLLSANRLAEVDLQEASEGERLLLGVLGFDHKDYLLVTVLRPFKGVRVVERDGGRPMGFWTDNQLRKPEFEMRLQRLRAQDRQGKKEEVAE